MKTSPYLEQTLFYEQNPATDQFYESRSDTLFQDPGKDAFIEIHEQLPCTKFSDGSILYGPVAMASKPKPSAEFSSVPPSPVDSHRYGNEAAPRYREVPGLVPRRVGTQEELKSIASVRLAKDAPNTPANASVI